jgi:hypothetical protein
VQVRTNVLDLLLASIIQSSARSGLRGRQAIVADRRDIEEKGCVGGRSARKSEEETFNSMSLPRS